MHARHPSQLRQEGVWFCSRNLNSCSKHLLSLCARDRETEGCWTVSKASARGCGEEGTSSRGRVWEGEGPSVTLLSLLPSHLTNHHSIPQPSDFSHTSLPLILPLSQPTLTLSAHTHQQQHSTSCPAMAESTTVFDGRSRSALIKACNSESGRMDSSWDLFTSSTGPSLSLQGRPTCTLSTAVECAARSSPYPLAPPSPFTPMGFRLQSSDMLGWSWAF